MKTLIASAMVALVLALAAGCTDLKPLQAQVDQLKAQLADLSSHQDHLKADIDIVARAASEAMSAAEQAQNRADAAAQTAQQGSDAINEKIDRMFKKSPQK
jgi:outer membrane murein-binding lipoprotein Lpp